jgi:hypothetical protein
VLLPADIPVVKLADPLDALVENTLNPTTTITKVLPLVE